MSRRNRVDCFVKVLTRIVVSELRKVRAGKADAQVARWADSIDATSLYLSAITVLELESGVLQIERRDAKQSAVLRTWLDDYVLPEFAAGISWRESPP